MKNKLPLAASRLSSGATGALLPLLLSLGLAGCGGGGGSSTDLATDRTDTGSGGGTTISGGETPGPTGQPPATSQPPGSSQPPDTAAPPSDGSPAGPAPVIKGSSVVGAWDPRILSWGDGSRTILPIHAALLPDGRVMSYGTHFENDGKLGFEFDVWTPPTASEGDYDSNWRHMLLPTGIEAHLFCSNQILIPTTGQLLITGGDNWTSTGNTNTGTSAITLYTPSTNKMVAAGQMNEARWYGSVLTLPDGSAYIQGGTDGGAVYGDRVPARAERAEIRDPATGTSRVLMGFNTRDLDNNYPRNFLGPDGMVYGFDHQVLYRIDPRGQGSRADLYPEDYEYGWTATSTAVMFEPGRILQIGKGGWKDENEGLTAQIIDLNGIAPTVTNAAKAHRKRQWANSTVLPDGKVVVMGGSEENAIADQVNWTLGRVAYEVEIYDPVANTWTLGPAQKRMRLYHSIALLLPNGAVLSGSGGWPGPQRNEDAEIYYPPYLFNADGTRAARPTISGAPTVLEAGAALTITTPDAADVSRITIIKTGSVTHSFNFEQRFLELGNVAKAGKPIVRQGNQLTVNLPANRFETPPGYYMVFALNAAGVPSEGKIFRINPSE